LTNRLSPNQAPALTKGRREIQQQSILVGLPAARRYRHEERAADFREATEYRQRSTPAAGQRIVQ
jgi:hypothetical protein